MDFPVSVPWLLLVVFGVGGLGYVALVAYFFLAEVCRYERVRGPR